MFGDPARGGLQRPGEAWGCLEGPGGEPEGPRVAPVRIFPRTASRPTPLHPTHRRTSLRHMCQLRTLARRRGGEKNLRSNFAWVWPGDLFTLLILETPSEAPATFTMGSPLTRPFTRGASPANSYKGSFPEQLQRELLRSVTRGASPFSYNGSFPSWLELVRSSHAAYEGRRRRRLDIGRVGACRSVSRGGALRLPYASKRRIV